MDKQEEADKAPREEYAVVMGFLAPYEGVVSVQATSKEDAKAIVEKQFSNRQGVVIADVYALSEVEKKESGAIPADLLNPKLN